jgi:ADP-ribosyl-[dinitrogen reductase] hydrolase
MICGVIGDYIGSIYENRAISSFHLPLITPCSHITDESVAIAAVADVLINDLDYGETFLKWFNRFPDVTYGFGTASWIMEQDVNYVGNSDGNLAASRAAPIGYLDLPLGLILEHAQESARPTHNSEDGINGALAIAYTIWSIRKGKLSQQEIFNYLFSEYNYLMDFYTLENIKNSNETGSGAFNTVPMAIWLGMSGKSYTDTLKNILYINSDGLDTDSIMSMASSVAFAYHFGGNIRNANADKEYKKLEFETKRYLFQSKSQPILQVVQEFELSKEICGIPF